MEDIIVAMENRQQYLTDILIRLHAISPKKITMPDGSVMVWRCPDELIPDSDPVNP